MELIVIAGMEASTCRRLLQPIQRCRFEWHGVRPWSDKWSVQSSADITRDDGDLDSFLLDHKLLAVENE